MSVHPGLRDPGRSTLVIPIVFALVAVALAAAFAWAHLSVRGPGPELARFAQRADASDRGAYGDDLAGFRSQ